MALQLRSKPVHASTIYVNLEGQCRLRPGKLGRSKLRRDLSCHTHLSKSGRLVPKNRTKCVSIKVPMKFGEVHWPSLFC